MLERKKVQGSVFAVERISGGRGRERPLPDDPPESCCQLHFARLIKMGLIQPKAEPPCITSAVSAKPISILNELRVLEEGDSQL